MPNLSPPSVLSAMRADATAGHPYYNARTMQYHSSATQHRYHQLNQQQAHENCPMSSSTAAAAAATAAQHCYTEQQHFESGEAYMGNIAQHLTSSSSTSSSHVRRAQRYPFERTVSSPEFYPLQQYFPDLTNLHSGQSQSMPTFDNSATSDVDQTLHNYTPSPENLSTDSRSPSFYNNSSSLGFFR